MAERLVLGQRLIHPVPMSERADEQRFRHLPERVAPEDLVETVDVSELPTRDEETEQRERFLRSAGGI
jgi:hypothetical protein